MAWHLRTGDVSLYANNRAFYTRIHSQVCAPVCVSLYVCACVLPVSRRSLRTCFTMGGASISAPLLLLPPCTLQVVHLLQGLPFLITFFYQVSQKLLQL